MVSMDTKSEIELWRNLEGFALPQILEYLWEKLSPDSANVVPSAKYLQHVSDFTSAMNQFKSIHNSHAN